MFDIGGVTQALHDLQVDPEQIKKVSNALTKAATSLDSSPLVNNPVAPTFGGSSPADSLKVHHDLARQVIEDTVGGVAMDLNRFAEGVTKAVRLVEDADNTNAAQLQAKQRAVEVLATATGYSEGDRRNHESRNENVKGDQ